MELEFREARSHSSSLGRNSAVTYIKASLRHA